MNMAKRWWLPLFALAPFPAQADDQEPQDLSSLSIEELAQIPVSAASKRDEPLSSVPNAAYVITNDDILRSSATSIPEVLRQAPNLQVERVNTTQYAISSRGFGGYEPANKLLVLVDGRSVYSTLQSGVFWELRSPFLEDIAQIEVVGGPGGTLYGPNAVNGVISIVSKDARDAQGGIVRGTIGANQRTVGARYGFKLGESAAVRVYGNWFDRGDSPAGRTPDFNDSIRGWQAGFRADMAGEASHVTVQGDMFDNETFRIAGDGNRGRNLLARWTGDLSDASQFRVQAYYDYFQRRELLTVDVLETFDVETQYNLTAGGHRIVAGFGLRTTRDEFINNLNNFQLDPPRARLWIGNGFVQDRVALSPHFSVTAGLKLEGSTFTGIQVLPNLRLAWQPGEKTLLWASVSRAVRTPSRIDRNLTEPVILAKAPAFASEKLIAFEAGYRGQPGPATALSVSVFYNHYVDLRSARFIGNPLPLQLANDLRGKTIGIEAQITQQVTPWWRLTGSALWLHKEFELRPGQADLTGRASLGQDPDYQFSLRSQMTLPHGILFDAGLRAIDGLDTPQLDGYVEADARLAVRLSDKVELFVAGENLLHDSHLESNDAQRSQRIERSVWAGTRLRF
ncbi:TonB-dependent receptor plug domain-containing protein [Sphingomonas sp.]|jgi:iron complex outermembrane receptor protein|uniref:TonB-dependent receptor plug domain-containing protein n=1 Tax=Sphingomonas sp. TaxID=28214 RepID=UPI002EDB3D51